MRLVYMFFNCYTPFGAFCLCNDGIYFYRSRTSFQKPGNEGELPLFTANLLLVAIHVFQPILTPSEAKFSFSAFVCYFVIVFFVFYTTLHSCRLEYVLLIK